MKFIDTATIKLTAGKGGDGASTRSGDGFLYGTRKVVNVTAPSQNGYTNSEIANLTQNISAPKSGTNYENELDKNSVNNITGRPGAVVIVW